MRYCIFGGSFDPPHEGHRYLAQSACDSLNLDRIFWVPAPDPPHKSKPGTPFDQRVDMVKLFLGNGPKQTVSDIERDLPAPSYSLNTIRAMQDLYGHEQDWHFLIGADNWSIFPTWHRYQEVLKAVTMVVFPRKGYPIGALPPGVMKLNLPEMRIQSRRIREVLAATRDFDQALVPSEIRPYIVKHNLYGMGASA